MKTAQAYGALANLLAYPEASLGARIKDCRAALEHGPEEAATLLQRFLAAIDGLPIEELQELYTRTFDLNPICSLEVGWQLFGENYSCGEFLVEMRQTLRRFEVAESTELPDHLTHVLTAFGRMPAWEADRFASKFLLPAIAKMLEGLRDKDCPFEHLLEATRAMIWSPCGSNCPSPSASEGRLEGTSGPSLALRLESAWEEVHHG